MSLSRFKMGRQEAAPWPEQWSLCVWGRTGSLLCPRGDSTSFCSCAHLNAKGKPYLLVANALRTFLHGVLVKRRTDFVYGAGLAAFELQADVLQLGDEVPAQRLLLFPCHPQTKPGVNGPQHRSWLQVSQEGSKDGLPRPPREPVGLGRPGLKSKRRLKACPGPQTLPFSNPRSSISYFWVQTV